MGEEREEKQLVWNRTNVKLAFNEWMRRYIEEPKRYEKEIKTVKRFVKEEKQGIEPSYGEFCFEYLNRLIIEFMRN